VEAVDGGATVVEGDVVVIGGIAVDVLG